MEVEFTFWCLCFLLLAEIARLQIFSVLCYRDGISKRNYM